MRKVKIGKFTSSYFVAANLPIGSTKEKETMYQGALYYKAQCTASLPNFDKVKSKFDDVTLRNYSCFSNS